MAAEEAVKPSTPPPEFEAPEPNEPALLAVLDLACRTLEAAGIDYGLLGGIASAVLGRPRWTHDIDIFLRPEDAAVALGALRSQGFLTHETNPHWLYKALKDGVLIDVLFRAKRDVFFDDEMAARCRLTEFKGIWIRTVPPEDLIIIKAIIHDEETPRHWFDALEVLAAQEIDWDYLIRRSMTAGPKRMLALLHYALSIDIAVPETAIVRLHELTYAQ